MENKSQRIKDIWINENLTYKQQVYFAKKNIVDIGIKMIIGKDLGLIYEGKNTSARRTLNRISGDLRKLGEARLALSEEVRMFHH